MKKILTASILLTLIVSSGAFAASARWNALGNDHRFIIDTTNYTVYPGRITLFGNALFIIPVPTGDIKEAYDERYFADNGIVSGALLNVKNMTLAFHYNLATDGTKNLNKALAGFAGQNDSLAGLSLRTFPDLFWGMKVGNISLGARVAVAKDSSEDSATVKEKPITISGVEVGTETGPIEKITTSAKSIDLSLGATVYKTPAGDLDLGLRAGVQSFSDDNPNNPKDHTTVESQGGTDMAFDARLNKPIGETNTLVSFLNLNKGENPSAKYDEITAPNVIEASYQKGELGLGFRNAIKDKGTFIAGVVGSYVATKSKTTTTIVVMEEKVVKSRTKKELPETKDTTMGATVLAGYERPLTKWLIIRGGANVKFSTLDDEIAVSKKTEQYPPGKTELEVKTEDLVRNKKSANVDYYYNMGFRTIVFGGWIIDVVLSRNSIHRGPYFLTGASGIWATNVCVTYAF